MIDFDRQAHYAGTAVDPSADSLSPKVPVTPLTPSNWAAAVEKVATELVLDPSDEETWRLSLVQVWASIYRAPPTISVAFGQLVETNIVGETKKLLAAAEGCPVALEVADCSTVEERLLRMAVWLRATEQQLTDVDYGSPSADPNVDWRYLVDDEPFFLVPMRRSAWRQVDASRSLSRTFEKRSLLRFRVLPGRVGGVPIRLTDRRNFGLGRQGLNFGASVFTGFDIVAKDENDPHHFIAKEVVGPTPDLVREHVAAAADGGCAVHVFPELSLDLELRNVVADTLSRAPWLSGAASMVGPDFVIAGSWHVQDEDQIRNEAIVYDRGGDELLRVHKLFPYRDKQGRYEQIQVGERLEVLVTAMGLYGFGICLDLCSRVKPILTHLDVDWVLVPSCGDWKTMDSHLAAATDLQIRFDARCFVVQQLYPEADNGTLGYVLPAPIVVGKPTESDVGVSQPFTIWKVVA